MFPEQNSDWQPSTTISLLQERAKFLASIRNFFAIRGVYEVDTPLLSQGVATDPFLQAFAVSVEGKNSRYLQTSPEFAMKRLIAAGSGAIYYLGKAFRKGEVGVKHNPEFTMLEWYRPEWDMSQLIDEVGELFKALLNVPLPDIQSYSDLFLHYLGIHPHWNSLADCQRIALDHQWVNEKNLPQLDKDGWLDLLMTHGIEPHLGKEKPIVVIDYPASQASLAKVKMVGTPSHPVAERFEIYYQGMELANGYQELTCANEQKKRFQEDSRKREALKLESLPIDSLLIEALEAGFPHCAGVAVGVDRLLMLKLKQPHIATVIPFVWEYA